MIIIIKKETVKAKISLLPECVSGGELSHFSYCSYGPQTQWPTTLENDKKKEKPESQNQLLSLNLQKRRCFKGLNPAFARLLKALKVVRNLFRDRFHRE